MKKSTKGAVAAAAAAVLLLGGAGSLAYWSDADTVDGNEFNSGQLSLTPDAADPAGDCETWLFDADEEAASKEYVPATDLIVPGDVISKVCAFDVLAEGEHLRATVGATPGTDTGTLLSALDISIGDLLVSPTGDFETATPLPEVGGAQTLTEANDGDTLYVAVDVAFDPTSGNATQSNVANGAMTALLDDINIVTTQVHEVATP